MKWMKPIAGIPVAEADVTDEGCAEMRERFRHVMDAEDWDDVTCETRERPIVFGQTEPDWHPGDIDDN